jgi:hypothetical protein
VPLIWPRVDSMALTYSSPAVGIVVAIGFTSGRVLQVFLERRRTLWTRLATPTTTDDQNFNPRPV